MRKSNLVVAFFTDEKIPFDVGKLVCIFAFFIQFFFLCKKILHMFIMTRDKPCLLLQEYIFVH